MNEDTYKRLWSHSRKLFPQQTPINFFPVIGKDYFSAPVKILSLGDSHYSPNPEQSNCDHFQTFETVVGQYMQRRWQRNNFSFHEMAKGDKFEKTAEEKEKERRDEKKLASFWRNYRKIANLICDCPQDDCNCDYVCDSIAFYNYFQKVVGPEAHNKDYLKENPEVFKNEAELAFKAVMDVLKPDVVLVWGQELSKEMPNADHRDGFYFFYDKYPKSRFLWMYHPVSSDWNTYYANSCIHLKQLCARQNLPIAELINTHSPFFGNVVSLSKVMSQYIVGGFTSFYSEIAYTCRFYEIQNGIEREEADYSMYLEAAYMPDSLVRIRFYTQNFKADTAWSILQASEFMVNANVQKSQFEGRYTLDILPANCKESQIVEKLRFYMKKMLNWREHNCR